MKRLVIFCFVIIIILLTAFTMLILGNATKKVSNLKLSRSTSTPTQKFTPFYAYIKIFTEGEKIDFSNLEKNNNSKDIHLSKENPEKIIVGKNNATWKDFFLSLPEPIRLTSSCLTIITNQNFCTTTNKKLTFYLNNSKIQNPLLSKINPNDSLLIVYGDNNSTTDVLGASTTSAVLQ